MFYNSYMKRRLYFLRHGQTVFNTQGIAQGRVDSPLTELGKSEANNAKKYFESNDIKYGPIYTSPLSRAVETCKIVTGKTGVPVADLIEVSFGQLDGKSYLLCKPYNDDFTSIGGESRDIAGQRLLNCLSSLMQEANEDVLVVSHATVGRCFYYKVIGEYDASFRMPNCGIAIYDFEDGKFSFVKMVNPNA